MNENDKMERRGLIIGILEILFSFILGVAFDFTFALYALIGFFIAVLLVVIFLAFMYQMSKISVNWNILLFIFGGFIVVGIIVGSIIFASFASINQYPISIQVFYPNHPNITITQNCTDFTTSALGYINGNLIPQNTTECNLPQSMAHLNDYNYYNPFICNIIGKNITCNSSGLYGINENATWKGTILNVSKR